MRRLQHNGIGGYQLGTFGGDQLCRLSFLFFHGYGKCGA